MRKFDHIEAAKGARKQMIFYNILNDLICCDEYSNLYDLNDESSNDKIKIIEAINKFKIKLEETLKELKAIDDSQ